jgi:peptidoglycan hydrolase-like protein with peptidoglycan-binding domain
MYNRDVEDLYTYVKYGTPVYIYGGLYGPFGNGARNLKPGDKGVDVVEVQRRLKLLGYYKGSIDGVYGPGMENALYSFQRDNGLPKNRVIYYETYRAMGIIMMD